MTDKADKKKKQQRNLAEFEKLAYERIMSREEGRFLMWDWMTSCGVFDNQFSPDPHVNAFNSGVRSMGLKVQSDLMEHTRDMYYKMIEENTDE